MTDTDKTVLTVSSDTCLKIQFIRPEEKQILLCTELAYS